METSLKEKNFKSYVQKKVEKLVDEIYENQMAEYKAENPTIEPEDFGAYFFENKCEGIADTVFEAVYCSLMNYFPVDTMMTREQRAFFTKEDY